MKKDLPKFIALSSKNRRGTCFKKGEHSYSTRGWDLPLENVDIDEKTGVLTIKNFMTHLNGKELVEISEHEYNEDQLPE